MKTIFSDTMTELNQDQNSGHLINPISSLHTISFVNCASVTCTVHKQHFL